MTLPSSPTDLAQIRRAMEEISHSMTRIEAERDLIRDIINNTCGALKLDKKVFRRTARVYHRRNYTTELQEQADFEQLYESVTHKSQEAA